MNPEIKRRVTACAAGFALPRYADIPDVGLYLDQTVKYINGFLQCFPGMEITSSMVSNYVKKGLVSHPLRKKYSRTQIAYLIYITVAKTVLSLEAVAALTEIQQKSYTPPVAYDYFCAELENLIAFVYGLKTEVATVGTDETEEKYLLRSVIIPAAHKIYLDCYFYYLREYLREQELAHIVGVSD